MRSTSVKKYLKEHRIIGRWTTFNNSLQSALAIPESFDESKLADAMRILGQNSEDLKCVYCGKDAATWDHLYNNVVNGRFSGYGHRIFNLVPACRTCNESKGNKHWRDFLEKLNPSNLNERIKILTEFEARSNRERLGWQEIVAAVPDLAKQYDQVQTELRASLERADFIAQQIRSRLRESRTE